MRGLKEWIHLPILSLFAVLLGCSGSQGRSTRSVRTSERHRVDPYRNDIEASTRRSTQHRRGDWSLTSDKVQKVSSIVAQASTRFALPEDLVFGIIWVESRFDPKATSPVGAKGLMQLMPRTATYLADCIDWDDRVDAFDPTFNITAGSYYIARLIKEFDGNEALALAAYNAGPTKVKRWLSSDGLPKGSVAYATMVQTARAFFNPRVNSPATAPSMVDTTPIITNEALDRLGLTILIAGLNDTPVGSEREDDATPFN
jgi:hypothetical protein